MPRDSLTLQETHGLLRHIERTTEQAAEALFQYDQFATADIPLVGTQVRHIIDGFLVEDDVSQVSIASALTHYSRKASELADEIEQAGKPPVPAVQETDDVAEAVEEAAQAAETAPESPSKPAEEPPSGSDGSEPQSTPRIRLRPAQASALTAMHTEGYWTPDNPNKQKTAQALIGKGWATRDNAQEGNGRLLITETGLQVLGVGENDTA